MITLNPKERRELARELTKLANASVEEVVRAGAAVPTVAGRRIGFTGSPGVGKSTLVGKFVERRAARLAIGVLGIDPASPYSRGAVLGDRIRMDEASDNPHVFMRSVSSRDAYDGLCNNVADLLLAIEARGFDEIILETVGVGQAEHAVKKLVDTVVLLVQPETGDGIQALKAGILEVADIIVISKADLDGAHRMKENLESTVRFGAHRAADWQVPVLPVSASSGSGLDALDAAVEKHAQWCATHRDRQRVQAERAKYRAHDLITRRLGEIMQRDSGCGYDSDLRATYTGLIGQLYINAE